MFDVVSKPSLRAAGGMMKLHAPGRLMKLNEF
jgi:hypothetical protein